MIKILIFILLFKSQSLFAATLKAQINQIESQWAKIYYQHDNNQSNQQYNSLLARIKPFIQTYPQAVELKIWQAIILSSKAAFEDPITALNLINQAKQQLEQSLKTNPNGLEGAAFVVLGTLYYMTPPWPISFGNMDTAAKLLKQGLAINPLSIDAHYFYADYLIEQGDEQQATQYLKQALALPNRIHQPYADQQLKQLAQHALDKNRQNILNQEKNKFWLLFGELK